MKLQRDFTLFKAKKLFEEFLQSGYIPSTLQNYLINLDKTYDNKVVIFRHDVDRGIRSALEMAQLENVLKIPASYYFRYRKNTFNREVIIQVANMGHEVGYHYEVLSKANGNLKKAKNIFEKELADFRKIVDVKTICMHGSPLSKWDSRKLWEEYNYKEFGIIGEPYFDLDYEKVLYLTDTGRRWDGAKLSVRDKVDSIFHTDLKRTEEIIKSVREDLLPNVVMINMHPNRWNNDAFEWTYELASQAIKNVVKKYLFVRRVKS